MAYKRLHFTKAERSTFRRHFPIWFSVHVGYPSHPLLPSHVYLRVGDDAHLWTFDSLVTYMVANDHGQRASRKTALDRAAFTVGWRRYKRRHGLA